jgi:hypothetical protein
MTIAPQLREQIDYPEAGQFWITYLKTSGNTTNYHESYPLMRQ